LRSLAKAKTWMFGGFMNCIARAACQELVNNFSIYFRNGEASSPAFEFWNDATIIFVDKVRHISCIG
jgi:hypothetical protein